MYPAFGFDTKDVNTISQNLSRFDFVDNDRLLHSTLTLTLIKSAYFGLVISRFFLYFIKKKYKPKKIA
jgi:hypothetical protein